MRIAKWRLVAGFAAVALTAACSGEQLVAGTPTTASTPDSRPPGPPTRTSNSTPSVPAQVPGTDGTAKPDSTFSLGSRAVVPYNYTEKTGDTIGLTVTSIQKGDPADLANLRLNDRAKGLVPYYILVTVENLSGTDLHSIVAHGYFSGLLPDGSEADDVVVYEADNFAKCPVKSAPENFTVKGATYQTCQVTLAPPASAVTGATWWDEPYSLSHPVMWK